MARRKNRWVLAKINFPDHRPDDEDRSRVLTREAFETELLRVCDLLFGSIGGVYVANATNVVVINETDSFVLFQTRRCFLPKLLCVLRCFDRLQKATIKLDVFHVGGTLHHCKKLLFTSLLETLSQLNALRLTGTPQHSSVIKNAISSISEVTRIRNPSDF